MNSELFRTARDYHGAMAAYCRALRTLENLDDVDKLEKLEDLAQEVVGATLRYRALLDKLIAGAQGGSDEERIARRRLASLRSLLHFTSWSYNALAKAQRPSVQPSER